MESNACICFNALKTLEELVRSILNVIEINN